MILLERAHEYADLRINRDEMVLLNNALNEVCHGVKFEDGEFHTRLGATKAEGRALLDQMSNVLDAMK